MKQDKQGGGSQSWLHIRGGVPGGRQEISPFPIPYTQAYVQRHTCSTKILLVNLRHKSVPFVEKALAHLPEDTLITTWNVFT